MYSVATVRRCPISCPLREPHTFCHLDVNLTSHTRSQLWPPHASILRRDHIPYSFLLLAYNKLQL